jgi:hypothetical protein
MRFWFREWRYERRRKRAVAVHEATHAVVALRLGLPVEWASIVPGYDRDEKMHYPAAVKITNEAKQDQRLVLAAQAAVEFVATGDEGMDHYAVWEARRAYRDALMSELDPWSIRSRARREAQAGLPDIDRLTRRLLRRGHVQLAA